jgi:hypothetical protein
MNDYELIASEIRELLEHKRKSLQLTFTEDSHKYTMMDLNGNLREDYPSVSSIVKKFHPTFLTEEIALRSAGGDEEEAKKLIEKWESVAEYAINVGSRTHYLLENEILSQFSQEKEVRKPIFDCDFAQIVKSDSMVYAGGKYIELMKKRNAYLLDTEMVLGHPELGYVGQPDKMWIIFNKDKLGLICTDWKTNKPSKFEKTKYTVNMFSPFEELPDNAFGHYSVQLSLYCKLLLKMLEGTKYENIELFGCIIVLLKEDGTFEEFRVHKKTIDTILNLDINNFFLT